jgi:hypothetical protein
MRPIQGLAILLAVSSISVVRAQPPATKADVSRVRRETLSNWFGPKPLSKPALLNGGMFDAMLRLDSDQKAKIGDIFAAKSKETTDLLEQMRAVNLNVPFKPNDPQQRAKSAEDGRAMAALRERLDREAELEIKAVLEPNQWQRFEELQLQFNGPQAFLQPEIQDRLHLDVNQVQAIEAAIAKVRQEMMQALPIGGPGPPPEKGALSAIQAKRQEASTKFRASASKEISEILTKAQRVDYEKMLGKPYDKKAFVQGEPEAKK